MILFSTLSSMDLYSGLLLFTYKVSPITAIEDLSGGQDIWQGTVQKHKESKSERRVVQDTGRDGRGLSESL